LQDIELAQISQRVSRAFYNRLPLEADVRVGVSVATDRVSLTGLDAKGWHGLLPPPALRECRHRSLARCLV